MRAAFITPDNIHGCVFTVHMNELPNLLLQGLSITQQAGLNTAPTEAGKGDDLRTGRWTRSDRSAIRRVALEGQVEVVIVMVANVFAAKAAQVRFAEHDHVVQDFSADAALG